MELNLIEYLESKNFEIEEIAKLEEKYVKNEAFGNIKKYESIYKIFSFTDITNYEINKLIINNLGLLLKSDSELIKIAYVWNGTFLLSDAALRKRGLNSDNVNRTYLRNLYLNSNIKYNDSRIDIENMNEEAMCLLDEDKFSVQIESFMKQIENILKFLK